MIKTNISHDVDALVQYLEHGAEMIITEENTEFSLFQTFLKTEKSAYLIIRKQKQDSYVIICSSRIQLQRHTRI